MKDAKTASEMITALKNIFERKSTLSKLYIRRQLLTLKCEDTNLQDHFMKFDSLIRDLEATGTKLDEDDKVCHLLLTMTEKYQTVITVLETSLTTLTLDFVKGKLLDAELKLKNTEQNMPVRNEECSFVSNEKPRCFNCGSKDHLIAKCPKPRKTYRGGQGRRPYRGGHRGYRNKKKDSDEAHTAEEISFIALNCKEDSYCNNTVFVLDSGASNHFVKEEIGQYMKNITNLKHEVSIHIANGEVLKATKKGQLKTMCQKRVLNIEALVVPGLKHNLLSASKLTSKGCKIIVQQEETLIKGKGFTLRCNVCNVLKQGWIIYFKTR